MLYYLGSIKWQVSFEEYRLFYRALLQKRPIILPILLTKATPYALLSIIIYYLSSDVSDLLSHVCYLSWNQYLSSKVYHLSTSSNIFFLLSMSATIYYLSFSTICHLSSDAYYALLSTIIYYLSSDVSDLLPHVCHLSWNKYLSSKVYHLSSMSAMIYYLSFSTICYGVASDSRMDKIIGLFCRI